MEGGPEFARLDSSIGWRLSSLLSEGGGGGEGESRPGSLLVSALAVLVYVSISYCEGMSLAPSVSYF